MSARNVDVLAEMQSDIDALEQRVLAGEFTLSHGYDKVNRLRGLRAAMAELIEAANRARGIIAIHGDRCPQLEAALANVGGLP